MAYINQEMKKELSVEIKKVCAKYGVRSSVLVRHHAVLEVTLYAGPLDLLGKYIKSRYDGDEAPKSLQLSAGLSIGSHWQDAEIVSFLMELSDAMMKGNHDNSDLMTDYFDVGWYAYINVGRWDKPYQFAQR